MKKHLSTILIVLIFIVGIGLLAYPSFSNWWNQTHQARAIAVYQESVAETDDGTNEELLAAAEEYNARLLEERTSGNASIGQLTDEQLAEYESQLSLGDSGVIGYIRIPKIDVELPIYHGTDEAVLQIAVGHLEGSSLPVGGVGTHAVLSGHRGLPSAKLFTDIDSLGIGDVFIITCLNRKITYEVDQIVTVLPSELDELAIDPEQDYCTLVTCTPYGINSHRLLVRGHRIENLLDDQIETIQVEIPERELTTQERLQQYLPYAVILAAGFFGLALILPGKRKDENDEDDRHDAHKGYRRNDRVTRERRARREQRRLEREQREQEYENEPEFYDDDEDSWNDDSWRGYTSHYEARGDRDHRGDDDAAGENEDDDFYDED